MGIHDLIERRRLGHDAEPAERIGALEGPHQVFRNAVARHAMLAVAAGDIVAFQPLRLAVLLESDPGLFAVEIVKRYLPDIVDYATAVARSRPVKLLGDGGLAERPHLFAGMPLGIDQ